MISKIGVKTGWGWPLIRTMDCEIQQAIASENFGLLESGALLNHFPMLYGHLYASQTGLATRSASARS